MQLKSNYLLGLLIATGLLAGCVKEPLTSSATSEAVVQNEPTTVQNVFPLPASGDDTVGQITLVRSHRGDTLSTIAQRYNFGYLDVCDANPHINANKVISTGTVVTLPTMYILPPAQYRKGIVINIPELRLYYFGNNEVMTFPVALGREGWRTPIAKTYVFRKEANPVWHVPASIRQYYLEKNGQEHPKEIESGPDNPLGYNAIYLQMNGYLIHGTNAPASIGNFVSSGCIRMYNQDVAALFDQVDKGTPVNIIYYPSLVGWKGNDLYLESHIEVRHEEGLYEVNSVSPETAINDAIAGKQATINWPLVKDVVGNHTGIPVLIGHQS